MIPLFLSIIRYSLFASLEAEAQMALTCAEKGGKALKTAISSAAISMQYSFRVACVACQKLDGKRRCCKRGVGVMGAKSKHRTHFNAI